MHARDDFACRLTKLRCLWVQLLARLNKERLGVLLQEMQDKSGGDARYAAALR